VSKQANKLANKRASKQADEQMSEQTIVRGAGNNSFTQQSNDQAWVDEFWGGKQIK
jgi:hypothetical protein